MNPKTTAVLFAIAAALAAFVYFYEIKGEQARIEAKAAEKRLFPDVDQGEISSISLRVSDASEIHLERHEGHWRIVAPIDFAADTFAADGVASAITQLMSESTIEDPQPLDAYGIRAGGTEIRFSVGDRERTLRIGSATPVGSNSYASVDGDDRVFTVASYQLSPFKKEAEEFRDKRILDFDAAAVKRVAIRWPEAKVVVERTAEGWQMVAPVEARADADAVEGLLTSLSLLRASGFVDEPGSDEETGFAPPQFAVEIEFVREGDAEPAIAHFAVGGVDESGSQRFVRGAAESLYLISQESLDGFPRRVVEYRDRQLADFDVGEARRIELGFASDTGETVAVSLRLEDGGWVSSTDPVKGEKWVALVDALSDLRAHDIVAEELGPEELQAMRLDPPKLLLQVYDGAGDSANRLAEVHFGVAFGDGVIARVPDRETIFLIDAAVADSIPADLDDYRSRFVAEPELVTDE